MIPDIGSVLAFFQIKLIINIRKAIMAHARKIARAAITIAASHCPAGTPPQILSFRYEGRNRSKSDSSSGCISETAVTVVLENNQRGLLSGPRVLSTYRSMVA